MFNRHLDGTLCIAYPCDEVQKWSEARFEYGYLKSRLSLAEDPAERGYLEDELKQLKKNMRPEELMELELVEKYQKVREEYPESREALQEAENELLEFRELGHGQPDPQEFGARPW